MTPKDVQRILAAHKLYNGAIDGYLGVQSQNAIRLVLGTPFAGFNYGWAWSRLGIAAAQKILKDGDLYHGDVDGLDGNLTSGAMVEWEHLQSHNAPLILDRTPVKPAPGGQNIGFPLQKNCAAFYGNPGPEVKAQLTSFVPPYKLVLDWERGIAVKEVTIHKKCAKSAEQAYRIALDTYGYYRLVELGLDRFAGSYNHRKMRGGTSWSMHAYGCAIDTYAGKNGLTTRAPDALFSGKDYVKWFDIWESVGWISLGREIGRDWMHVQAAKVH